MRTLLRLSVLAAALAAVSPAAAQALDAAAAQRIVEGCVRAASGKRQSHAIAVVDGGGALLAFLRMDGNAPGIGEFAQRKADAVAAWRFSTARMAANAATTPAFATAPRVVTMAGGQPVYDRSGAFVGAVGVSGEAPEDDDACAIAGVRAAGFSETRPAR